MWRTFTEDIGGTSVHWLCLHQKVGQSLPVTLFPLPHQTAETIADNHGTEHYTHLVP